MTATRSTGGPTGQHDDSDTLRPKPYLRPDASADNIVADDAPRGMGRRSVLGWVLAAPTLMVAAPLVVETVHPQAADAAIPAVPEPADLFDLTDLQNLAALPTSGLIVVKIHTNNTATFELPRCEVGQGVTTSTAMIIAEELDMPVSKVKVTLADARPELLFNQLTGGSNTTTSTYDAIRRAAAIARGRLMETAAKKWDVKETTLSTSAGVVHGPGGRKASYGSLAKLAAATTTTALQVTMKDPSEFTVIGKPHNHVDSFDSVTGRKMFATDMQIPGAMPAMIARPPTVLGTPRSVQNTAAVKAMPGVTDVVMISTGVAIRARTYGQCIDAIRALKVTWNPGTEDSKSDADVLKELKQAEIPLLVPKVPLLTKSIEGSFTFYHKSNSPLEPGTADASYDAEKGIEVWSCMKVPIPVKQELALKYGFPLSKVKVHVTEGGGSFGRHLFSDAAYEAVEIAKAMGKPVKLMWSRTDDFRQGRIHPMCISSARATWLLGNVLTYEHRTTSVTTSFSHGLGEILTAFVSKLPPGKILLSQSIFALTQTVSYNYGVTDQLLNEVDMGFITGSMRNIYSPDQRTTQELMTDKIAKVAGKDRYQFRKAFIKDKRGLAVLNKVAEAGQWGRKLPKGVSQGIAVHNEYKGWAAVLVEIDNRPQTVNREIRMAYTGPRATRVTLAVDVGMTINPKGLEAQMQGGIMDGIAMALTSSLHLDKGTFQEGSWDQYYYTRQWNVPPKVQVIIMPNTSDRPGGAGEFAVAPTMAATACAYGAAIGKTPTEFPINHNGKLPDDFFPPSPGTPQSPTDALSEAY